MGGKDLVQHAQCVSCEGRWSAQIDLYIKTLNHHSIQDVISINVIFVTWLPLGRSGPMASEVQGVEGGSTVILTGFSFGKAFVS